MKASEASVLVFAESGDLHRVDSLDIKCSVKVVTSSESSPPPSLSVGSRPSDPSDEEREEEEERDDDEDEDDDEELGDLGDDDGDGGLNDEELPPPLRAAVSRLTPPAVSIRAAACHSKRELAKRTDKAKVRA